MWGDFPGLLPERRVIVFDAPGVGRSSRPRVPLRMAGLADVVAALIAALGFDAVDVLGYSLGGGVAQELARRHPEKVAHLILCATNAGLGSVLPVNPLIPWILSTPLRYHSPRHMAAVTPLLAGGKTARDKHAQLQQVRVRVENPPSWLGYMLQVYAGSMWSSLLWLHRLTQPTLILVGSDDPLVPVINGRLLAHRIPNAQLDVLSGAGHLFLLDEPESAITPIRRFLDGRSAEDP